MPEFSIIIPIYKVEDYLRECVDSILSQQYADYEIILVDDGSPDSCPEICDEYAAKDSRIKVIHQQNSGVSAARNNGIKASDGKYLWFVDGDDGIADGAFEIIKSYMRFNFDVICFGGIPENIEPEKEEINGRKYSVLCGRESIAGLMNKSSGKSFIKFSWSKIFKASFIKSGEINFDSRLKYGEDSVFNFESLIRAERLVFSKDSIYSYRTRNDSASQKIDKTFDMNFFRQIELNCVVRDEIYKKYSIRDDECYYESKGGFVLEKLLVFDLVKKIYKTESKNKYRVFRKIASSGLIQDSFKSYDINKAKRKGLDWVMLWAVKHRLYFLGHLTCKYAFKNKRRRLK